MRFQRCVYMPTTVHARPIELTVLPRAVESLPKSSAAWVSRSTITRRAPLMSRSLMKRPYFMVMRSVRAASGKTASKPWITSSDVEILAVSAEANGTTSLTVDSLSFFIALASSPLSSIQRPSLYPL